MSLRAFGPGRAVLIAGDFIIIFPLFKRDIESYSDEFKNLKIEWICSLIQYMEKQVACQKEVKALGISNCGGKFLLLTHLWRYHKINKTDKKTLWSKCWNWSCQSDLLFCWRLLGFHLDRVSFTSENASVCSITTCLTLQLSEIFLDPFWINNLNTLL